MASKASQELVTTESPPEPSRELRKANEAIGLRVSEGKLTLLNRKLFNVLVFRAQRARSLGANAPIDTAAAKKYFWIPLADLARDASYDSKDTQFLKDQLLEMQDIKLLLETSHQWTSERLIASITFANPKGLKSRSGQVWVGFAFPPEVHESVMAPERYTRMSIVYQGSLRSGATLGLYEICRRYATNPSRVTSAELYEWWYGALTGNPVSKDEELPEYKYFKRDVIKPAIAEINQLTDIEIELIEHKNGRRVERLQFRVQETKQLQLIAAPEPVIDMELLQSLMAMGLPQHEALDALGTYDSARIREAIAFVNARKSQRNAAPLDSAAAYLRWVLRKGEDVAHEHSSKLLKAKKTQEAVEPQPDVMEQFEAARAKDAEELYREMSTEERTAVFDRFKQTSPKGVRIAAREKAMEHGPTRTLLTHWFARELWGEATTAQLAEFVNKNMRTRAPRKN